MVAPPRDAVTDRPEAAAGLCGSRTLSLQGGWHLGSRAGGRGCVGAGSLVLWRLQTLGCRLPRWKVQGSWLRDPSGLKGCDDELRRFQVRRLFGFPEDFPAGGDKTLRQHRGRLWPTPAFRKHRGRHSAPCVVLRWWCGPQTETVDVCHVRATETSPEDKRGSLLQGSANSLGIQWVGRVGGDGVLPGGGWVLRGERMAAPPQPSPRPGSAQCCAQ